MSGSSKQDQSRDAVPRKSASSSSPRLRQQESVKVPRARQGEDEQALGVTWTTSPRRSSTFGISCGVRPWRYDMRHRMTEL